jgi:two-component system chemotaxis sensor kinase CheA
MGNLEEKVHDHQQERPEPKQPPITPPPEAHREQDAASVKKVKNSMRVDADKIDYLINQVGELVVSRAYFAQLFGEMKALQQNLLEQTGMTKNQLKPLNEFSFRLGAGSGEKTRQAGKTGSQR